MHLHVAEVRDAHGGQVGAVGVDEAAAADAVGPEAFLSREAEGKGSPSATAAPLPLSHAH